VLEVEEASGRTRLTTGEPLFEGLTLTELLEGFNGIIIRLKQSIFPLEKKEKTFFPST
jgi:hypothetical protein